MFGMLDIKSTVTLRIFMWSAYRVSAFSMGHCGGKLRERPMAVMSMHLTGSGGKMGRARERRAVLRELHAAPEVKPASTTVPLQSYN